MKYEGTEARCWNLTLKKSLPINFSWCLRGEVLGEHTLASSRIWLVPWCILTQRKSDRNTRRPSWMKKLLLDKLNHKRKAYRKWQRGQVTWEGVQVHCINSWDGTGEVMNPTWNWICPGMPRATRKALQVNTNTCCLWCTLASCFGKAVLLRVCSWW